MTTLLLPLLAFLLGSLLIAGTAAMLMRPRSVAIERRLRDLAGPAYEEAAAPTAATQIAHTLNRIGDKLPRSPKELGKLKLRLTQAGFRRSEALSIFLAIRVGTSVGAFALFATPMLFRPNLFYGLGAAGLCYVLSGMVLARFAKRRQHRIRLALPDALDLLVVSVEAGLGLDQALLRVGQELAFAYADLAQEFRLVNLELLAGKSRSAALRNLADRTGVDDLSSLVAMLVQTDKFGTSVASSLGGV